MTSLTPDHAIALLERRHDGLVHTIGRACGADWGRDDVKRYLWNAESIQWIEHYSGHNVRAVAPDGRAMRFMTAPGVAPADAHALLAPFVPDPLGALRQIADEDGIDLHDLAPGDGEWVVRVQGARIVQWGRKIER